jgi:hypothetical protein
MKKVDARKTRRGETGWMICPVYERRLAILHMVNCLSHAPNHPRILRASAVKNACFAGPGSEPAVHQE